MLNTIKCKYTNFNRGYVYMYCRHTQLILVSTDSKRIQQMWRGVAWLLPANCSRSTSTHSYCSLVGQLMTWRLTLNKQHVETRAGQITALGFDVSTKSVYKLHIGDEFCSLNANETPNRETLKWVNLCIAYMGFCWHSKT